MSYPIPNDRSREIPFLWNPKFHYSTTPIYAYIFQVVSFFTFLCYIQSLLQYQIEVQTMCPPHPTPVNWLVRLHLCETRLPPYPDLYIHPNQLYQPFFWHKHEGTDKKSWKVSKFLPFDTAQ
jgi:hypothetical protein